MLSKNIILYLAVFVLYAIPIYCLLILVFSPDDATEGTLLISGVDLVLKIFDVMFDNVASISDREWLIDKLGIFNKNKEIFGIVVFSSAYKPITWLVRKVIMFAYPKKAEGGDVRLVKYALSFQALFSCGVYYFVDDYRLGRYQLEYDLRITVFVVLFLILIPASVSAVTVAIIKGVYDNG